MTQREFDREVSRATGESVAEIRRRGFSLLEPVFEKPLVIYWDAQDELRDDRLPRRQRANCLTTA